MRFLPSPATGIVVENAIDAARCSELIAQLAGRGFSPTGERYPRTYRDNDRLVFDDPELASELYARLGDRVPRELVVAGERWELCGFNARFRACRYRDGQAFCIHRDGPHAPSDDVRSHLTVQLYLDDAPAAGGRTRFYADAAGTELLAAIVPRRGAAIIFDHAAWHDGEAVTAGEKHVLRTDAMYRRVAAASRTEPRRALPGLVGMHRGYAWRVVACRDGTLASSGRDGTVRRWCQPPRAWDLGAGSVTALVEDSRGALWCGTRSGAIFVIGDVRAAGADVGRADGGATVTSRGDVEGSGDRVGSARSCGAEGDTNVGAVLDGCAVGERVVFATSRGTLVAFRTVAGASGGRLWTVDAHDGWAWGVVADGEGVASCGEDGRIVLVDRDGRAGTLAELGVPLRALARLPGGWLAGDTRGWLHQLDRAGDTIATTRAHAAAITAIAVVDDGWVTASEDGHVRRWRDGRCIATASGPDFVTSLAIAGDRIACAGYDGAIRIVPS